MAQPPSPERSAALPGKGPVSVALADEGSVPHADQTVRGRSDPLIVGDDDEREPVLVQGLEEPEHLEGGGAVEVAGGFVGEHDGRPVGQGAGDGDPLPLATGERRGQVTGPVGEADPLEELRGALPRLLRRTAGEECRKLDVLPSGELVHQVERLEDEADLVAPQLGQGAFGEPVDAPAAQVQLAGRRPVEPAQQVEKGRLPTAARPPHRHSLAASDLQVDVVDGTNEPRASPVVLPYPPGVHEHIAG